MFVSDRLVFVELHKTGGTHIGRWLDKLVGGEQRGKHNRVPAELRDRFILGSVRNPWDWYVSLWAYGCGGNGSVHAQVTRRASFDYCRRQLPSEMGKRRLDVSEWMVQVTADLRKPVAAWKQSYGSSDRPEAFRAWLRMLLHPDRRFDMGEGFGFSPVSTEAGLLTYRYLKLFTSIDAGLYADPAIRTLQGMRSVCDSSCIVRHFIRNEHLEEDLIEGLRLAGVSLDPDAAAQLKTASGTRTNSSNRRDARFYYDDDTANLVARREQLLIERHGYQFKL